MRQQQAYYTKKAIRTQKNFPKAKNGENLSTMATTTNIYVFFQNSFHSYIFVCLESDPQKNLEKFGQIFFWFKLYLTKSTEVNTSPSFEFTP